jgi:L-ascorbate metabolism protein UlaG (beta-lactamase superfamily)
MFRQVLAKTFASGGRQVRISKFIHSCLLFEHEGDKLLFDPGNFSFIEGRVTPETFQDVSTVVITHSHPDHLALEPLKRILALSGADVVTNGEVAAILHGEGIDATTIEEGTLTAGAFRLRAIPTPHEAILADNVPRHTAFLVNDRVLNGVDSFAEPLLPYAGVEVLIMPVMAPFLTEVGAAAFARRMRPRQVIPVHDGYAKDFFVRQRYDNYARVFTAMNIQFHKLTEPGGGVTV